MRRLSLCLSLTLLACPKPPENEPPPEKIHTTYRMLGGISMGAIGGMALATSNPDKVDGVAALGGPLDAAFFQRFMDKFVTGGFCTREELEAIMAMPDGGVMLNDPAVINACAAARVEQPNQWEHPNDFNHWHVTNNGGSFDRDAYIKMMTDLMLAYGNFFSDNPDSPVAPPGVPADYVLRAPADLCSNPVRVEGLKNAEYNPDGHYTALAGCDGTQPHYFCNATQEEVDFCSDPANIRTPLPQSQSQGFADAYCASKGGATRINRDQNTLLWLQRVGNVQPCLEMTTAATILLAYDYNGNGRRDYGEPIANNSHERFDDVGTDGCADPYENGSGGCNSTAAATDTDLNHDNYDVESNPTGTEKDWIYEQGEPFRDFGLDGVEGSGDTGEGNGVYDEVAARKRLIALDGRSNFRKWDSAARKRFSFLVDGGIHDIFNLGLQARHLLSGIGAVRTIGVYRDFLDIPGMVDRDGIFNPWNKAWARNTRDMAVLYGKDVRSDAEIAEGEGDHVGTAAQAVERFEVLFNWLANSWPTAPKPEASVTSSPGVQRYETYDSAVLGAKWEYSVALPPGYDDPENADARYPVAYLLHGYGMEPSGFSAVTLVSDNYVASDLKLRPMIYVFPNGRCCFINKNTGAKDCRNVDDQGVDIDADPAWERECRAGTFWVNSVGLTSAGGSRYGDAMFELMDYIDTKYRTMKPADVEAR